MSVLEFGAPVWNSGINKEQVCDIERVQKCSLHIVLGEDYTGYADALAKVGLDTLEERRLKLCQNFAKKAVKDPKHSNWFVEYKQLESKLEVLRTNMLHLCIAWIDTQRNHVYFKKYE
jgi:hypothetical protein